MLKMFVRVDKHQRSKSFICQTTSIMLEQSSSNAEKSFVIADYFFKLDYDIFSCVIAFKLFASQHSIVHRF